MRFTAHRNKYCGTNPIEMAGKAMQNAGFCLLASDSKRSAERMFA